MTKVSSFYGKILTIFYQNEVKMLNFAGKNALITGSTRGIGKAIAVEFAKLGANVIITGRDRKSAEVLANNIEKEYNVKAFGIDLDLAGDVSKSFEEINSFTQGKIDILVNNAGITKDGLLMRMTEDQWDAVINVNLKGVFNMTQAVSRSMLKARKGSIITLSSVVGLHGNAGQTNYAATKGGVVAMSKTWAKEFGGRNVRANCVAPGFIQTPMTDVLSEDTIKGMLDATPLGRLGQVEDIANTVLFLASDESSFITGEVISVSGGLML